MSARSRHLSAAGILVLLVLCVLGAIAYYRQLVLGDITTGLGTPGRGGVAWGLFVAMDGFFLCTGFTLMLVASTWRLFAGADAEAFARIAMPIAITSFLAAALSVLADQGRPAFSLWHLARVARPGSPLFYTFSLVGSVCLYGSLIQCVLSRRADIASYARKPSFWQRYQRILAAGYQGSLQERLRRATCARWQAIAMSIPLGGVILALAIIFVDRAARPTLPTLIELGSFLATGITAGLGMLAGASYLVSRFGGPSAGPTPTGYFKLARVLLVFAPLVLFTVVAKTVSHLLSGEVAARRYAIALFQGEHAVLFWTMLGLLFVASVVLFIGVRVQRMGMGALGAVGLLLQLAVFLDRYLVLVAWQTHGHSLPYEAGTYLPTLNEVLIAFGIVGFSILLLLPSVKLIPFAPVAFEPALPAGIPPGPDHFRRRVTMGWMFFSLLVSAVGYGASARLGTTAIDDPVIPASPAIFIAGLVLLATTPAVYELMPERRRH